MERSEKEKREQMLIQSVVESYTKPLQKRIEKLEKKVKELKRSIDNEEDGCEFP